MSLFNAKTQEADAKWNKPSIPFAEGLYLAEVQGVEIVEVEETDWSSGQPVKTGGMVQNFKVSFNLLSNVDGSPVQGSEEVLVDGVKTYKTTEPTFNTISAWYDPVKNGISKRGPTKTRVFLTTVLDLDPKAPLNTDIISDIIEKEALIGKQIKMYVSVTEGKNGRRRNVIEKISKK